MRLTQAAYHEYGLDKPVCLLQEVAQYMPLVGSIRRLPGLLLGGMGIRMRLPTYGIEIIRVSAVCSLVIGGSRIASICFSQSKMRTIPSSWQSFRIGGQRKLVHVSFRNDS